MTDTEILPDFDEKLDECVPCEVQTFYANLIDEGKRFDLDTKQDVSICGNPAVHHVRVHCLACDSSRTRFYCQPHFDRLLRGPDLACRECGTYGLTGTIL